VMLGNKIIIISMDLFESINSLSGLLDSPPETNFPGMKTADDNF